MARRGYHITLQAIDDLPVVQAAYDRYRARVRSFLDTEVDRLAADVVRRAVARAGTVEIPLATGRAQFVICQTDWQDGLPRSLSISSSYIESRASDWVDCVIKQGTQVGDDFRLEEDAILTLQVFTGAVARLPQAMKDAWQIAHTGVSIKRPRARVERSFNPETNRHESYDQVTNRHALVTIRLPDAPPEPPPIRTPAKLKTTRPGRSPKSRTFER